MLPSNLPSSITREGAGLEAPAFRVQLYREPRSRGLDLAAVASYLTGMLPGVQVELRPPLIEARLAGLTDPAADQFLAEAACGWAQAKVKKFDTPHPPGARIVTGEIDYERRRLQNSESTVFGLLYDAWALGEFYRSFLEADELRIDSLPIIFTNQLLGTWDPGDRRYHARTVICGAPSFISTSGLVEAPAKARGYYLARRSGEMLGLAEEEKMAMANELAGEHLAHEDPRLTEVVKGYVMQALVYRLTGDSFCDDPQCRLFNAHWQRELLNSQLGGSYDYCFKHQELFNSWAR